MGESWEDMEGVRTTVSYPASSAYLHTARKLKTGRRAQ